MKDTLVPEPVARKMPVRGSAPDADALNRHPLPHWGPGILPSKIVEILCTKRTPNTHRDNQNLYNASTIWL